MDPLDLLLSLLGIAVDGFDWAWIVGWILENLDFYRFYGCVSLAAGALLLLRHWAPHHTVPIFISAPIAAAGIGIGLAWEWRARR